MRHKRLAALGMSEVLCQSRGMGAGEALPTMNSVGCAIGFAILFVASIDVRAEAIEFDVSYLPAAALNPPSGVIVVRPPPGRMLIGSVPGAKVELRLPYETPVELNAMNFGPKASGDHRYVFRVPATFAAGRFTCGVGQPLTEVTVTDLAGATLSRKFALCPGIPFNAQAAGFGQTHPSETGPPPATSAEFPAAAHVGDAPQRVALGPPGAQR